MEATNQAITCPICLKRLRCCRLGKPEPCDHVFCFTCIFEWAKNVNTCPVDRIKFNNLEIFDSFGGECVEKVHIADQTLEDKPPDFTRCEVCNEQNREHELLLCDGCDKGYHLDCLSPALTEVPEGDWYCPNCQPIINAQYLDSISSETDSRMELDSRGGSESDSSITRPRRVSRVVITDSEDTESGSDIDEIQTRRTVNNICAIGEPRVLISESSGSDSESEIDVGSIQSKPKLERQNGHGSQRTRRGTDGVEACMSSSSPSGTDIETSYVDLLRKYTRSLSHSSTPTPDKMKANLQPNAKKQVPVKSLSVLVTPVKVGKNNTTPSLRRVSNPQNCTGPSTAHSSKHNATNHQSSTQTSNSHSSKHAVNTQSSRHGHSNQSTARTKKRRKRKKLVLGKRPRNKKRRKRQPRLPNTDRAYNPLPNCHVTPSSRVSLETRSTCRARTAASYTPQHLTFRAAARESYRHSDLGTGLESAQRIIMESNASFRHSPWANLPTPQSGYVRQNVDRTPFRERAALEIHRRSVPNGRKQLLPDPKPTKLTPSRGPAVRIGGESSSASGLVDEIFQNLDDLNNTRNIIQRDGTILPIRDDTETDPLQQPVSPVKAPICAEHNQNKPLSVSLTPFDHHQNGNHFAPHFTDTLVCLDDSGSEHELSIDEQRRDSPQIIQKSATGHRHRQWSQHKEEQEHLPQSVSLIEEPSSTSDSFIDVSSESFVRHCVQRELDKFRFAGEVSSHQYKRILERAIQKVMKGKNTTLERVQRLVSDYVILYKLSA